MRILKPQEIRATEASSVLGDLPRNIKAKDIGASKLTWFVFLSLFGAIFYCGYKIVPFYFYYFEIQNQMEQVIKLASTETDQEIRKKLEYHIKATELPVKPEDLKISCEGRTIKVSLKYTEIFYITFRGKDYDLREFKFHAFATGPF